MNIILYSVREEEKLYFEEWNLKNKEYNLRYVSEELSELNMNKIKGNDIVILSQVNSLSKKVYDCISKNNIKVIGTRSTGYDMFDLNFLKEKNIKLINVPSYSPRAIAEYVLTTALFFTRNMDLITQRVKKFDFRWSNKIISREIRTLTVGIIGTGTIGMETARLFKNMGANIIGYNPREKEENKNILRYTDLDSLLRKSDIVSLHAPLTSDNIYMIDSEKISLMKKNAILINAARGKLIDTKALLKAIDENKILGAAIDCYENEGKYIMKDNEDIDDELLKELISNNKIIYTPHIAFYTETAIRELAIRSIENAIEILKTGKSNGNVEM